MVGHPEVGHITNEQPPSQLNPSWHVRFRAYSIPVNLTALRDFQRSNHETSGSRLRDDLPVVAADPSDLAPGDAQSLERADAYFVCEQ
jgi:hypothetical protein